MIITDTKGALEIVSLLIVRTPAKSGCWCRVIYLILLHTEPEGVMNEYHDFLLYITKEHCDHKWY